MAITLELLKEYPLPKSFDALIDNSTATPEQKAEAQRVLNSAVARLHPYGIDEHSLLEDHERAALADLVGKLWLRPESDVDLSAFATRTLGVDRRNYPKPFPLDPAPGGESEQISGGISSADLAVLVDREVDDYLRRNPVSANEDAVARAAARTAELAAEAARGVADANALKIAENAAQVAKKQNILMPPSPQEAEGGGSTTIRGWTALLIRTAINAAVPAWARQANPPSMGGGGGGGFSTTPIGVQTAFLSPSGRSGYAWEADLTKNRIDIPDEGDWMLLKIDAHPFDENLLYRGDASWIDLNELRALTAIPESGFSSSSTASPIRDSSILIPRLGGQRDNEWWYVSRRSAVVSGKRRNFLTIGSDERFRILVTALSISESEASGEPVEPGAALPAYEQASTQGLFSRAGALFWKLVNEVPDTPGTSSGVGHVLTVTGENDQDYNWKALPDLEGDIGGARDLANAANILANNAQREAMGAGDEARTASAKAGAADLKAQSALEKIAELPVFSGYEVLPNGSKGATTPERMAIRFGDKQDPRPIKEVQVSISGLPVGIHVGNMASGGVFVFDIAENVRTSIDNNVAPGDFSWPVDIEFTFEDTTQRTARTQFIIRRPSLLSPNYNDLDALAEKVSEVSLDGVVRKGRGFIGHLVSNFYGGWNRGSDLNRGRIIIAGYEIPDHEQSNPADPARYDRFNKDIFDKLEFGRYRITLVNQSVHPNRNDDQNPETITSASYNEVPIISVEFDLLPNDPFRKFTRYQEYAPLAPVDYPLHSPNFKFMPQIVSSVHASGSYGNAREVTSSEMQNDEIGWICVVEVNDPHDRYDVDHSDDKNQLQISSALVDIGDTDSIIFAFNHLTTETHGTDSAPHVSVIRVDEILRY